MNLGSLAQSYRQARRMWAMARGPAPLGLPMPRGEGAGRGQGNNSRRRGGGYPQELKKPLCTITKLSQSLGNNHLVLSLSILFPSSGPIRNILPFDRSFRDVPFSLVISVLCQGLHPGGARSHSWSWSPHLGLLCWSLDGRGCPRCNRDTSLTKHAHRIQKSVRSSLPKRRPMWGGTFIEEDNSFAKTQSHVQMVSLERYVDM